MSSNIFNDTRFHRVQTLFVHTRETILNVDRPCKEIIYEQRISSLTWEEKRSFIQEINHHSNPLSTTTTYKQVISARNGKNVFCWTHIKYFSNMMDIIYSCSIVSPSWYVIGLSAAVAFRWRSWRNCCARAKNSNDPLLTHLSIDLRYSNERPSYCAWFGLTRNRRVFFVTMAIYIIPGSCRIYVILTNTIAYILLWNKYNSNMTVSANSTIKCECISLELYIDLTY